MNICLIFSFFFFFFSIFLFFSSLTLMVSNLSYFLEFEILNLNSNLILMTVLIDWMSLIFMSFVLFISCMVIFYSNEYMEGDMFKNRFIMLVVMFVLSMMFLIISPNLISILLGWDGLGLVSYCLVIYYQNIKSFNAGMLTALTNRIGDVALLMAIAWMLNYGSWNYVFYLFEFKNDFFMKMISLLVMLAAMTKSAQIPFSSWLPAAMAAPTPVSSLVHSSTLVTAGVYLMIRFNYVMSTEMMMILLFISSLTMFMSGLGANFEFDLKKIIALSTLSQLGLMMSILSLGGYKLAFFHLLTHALFKALLFMCAGNIIHNFLNFQDIRYMGSLVNLMPLTCTFMNISNLSLCGIPFLSGFYSKDLILEIMSMNYINIYIYVVFYVSIGLTVSYTFRLIYYSCIGNQNFISLNMVSEKNFIMLLGMSGLIFFVIFMGSILSWTMFSIPYFIILSSFMKKITLLMIFLGMLIGYELSSMKLNYENYSFLYKNYSWFFSSMWNMPYISTVGLNFYPLKLSNYFKMNLDYGWFEFMGAQKINFILKKESKNLQMLFNNSIKLFFMLLLVFLILIFML